MLVSASRRTDVPRFYLDWLMRRISEGYALVRNPVSRSRVSFVPLDRASVDCLCLWTKDAGPLLRRIEDLSSYPLLVQFTINAYGTDIEAGLPRKAELLNTFRLLARAIGPERVIWRYSPVLVGGRYTAEHHLGWFARFARELEGSTLRCRLGFLHEYPKIAARLRACGLSDVPESRKIDLAMGFAQAGKRHGIEVGGCGDAAFEAAGLAERGCIDADLVSRIAGVDARPLRVGGGASLRCRCAPSIDIGSYDTCAHGCVYCYANPGGARGLPWRARSYDPESPLLCDALRPGDAVVRCAARPLPPAQPPLF